MSHDLTVSASQGVYLNELNTKFRAFVAGFGGGKTFVGCLDQSLFFGRHPKTIQGYFAPTYRDIRDTFWPTVEEAAHLLGYRTKVKSGDKEVEFYRGKVYYGTTICRSMDDPGSIVGFKIAQGHVDEIDILSKDKAQNAWRKIIARLRLVVPGVENGLGVTTTPEGFKFVYDTFKRAPKERYSMVQASTYENEDHLPPDYIPSLLDDYPEELISAYLLGQFVNLTSGAVYRQYDRIGNRSDETMIEGEPLMIGQDFNVNNMSSAIFVRRPNGFHQVGELTKIKDTPALIETLRQKFPGHHITVYPDASGKSTKTVDASKSDLSLLRTAGLKVLANPTNPRVKDRILSVNAAFEKRKVWVNDKLCPRTAESLEQQAYDKNGEPDKDTGFDHLNDGFGYFVHWEMPVQKPIMRAREFRF